MTGGGLADSEKLYRCRETTRQDTGFVYLTKKQLQRTYDDNYDDDNGGEKRAL